MLLYKENNKKRDILVNSLLFSLLICPYLFSQYLIHYSIKNRKLQILKKEIKIGKQRKEEKTRDSIGEKKKFKKKENCK